MAKSRAGKQETLVSAAVLLVLAGIASWVFIRQARYDPEPFRVVLVDSPSSTSTSSAPPSKASETAIRLQGYLPEGLSVLTPPEAFGPGNLSDKIDGKAELYLSAGFVGLSCQRYVLAGNPASWLEVYLFDMGAPRNAFAVFSAQRRADGDALPLTRHAYRTANAVFFAHGHYYMEIVAAQAGDEIARSVLAFAANFVHQQPMDDGEVPEGPPFPPEDLDKTSITLLASDVFGFDELTQVYTASYQTTAGPMTAFVSERASAAEAQELAASYCRFLVANGGGEKPSAGSIPGVRVLQVFDSFEVVFTKGRYLLGVHDASGDEPAQHLAQRLYKATGSMTPRGMNRRGIFLPQRLYKAIPENGSIPHSFCGPPADGGPWFDA